jgi:hypothetical protein
MAQQYTPNIGELCTDDARRDAIHFAVAPVEAATDLRPGEYVGVTQGRASPHATPVGIVDPFFQGQVKKGQRFWLFLYPNTITSLRHVWTHPAFSPSPPVKGEVR